MQKVLLVVFASWLAVFVAIRRLLRGPRRPGWGFRFELAIELIKRLNRRYGSVPVPVMRAQTPDSPIPRSLTDRITVDETMLAGLPTERHTPEGWRDGDPSCLYIHGGGYIMCSPGTHRALIARIAAATGAQCWAIDYRMAPEHPYPAPVDDCVAAYKELVGQVDPESLFVGGDSAGGGLTLATLQRNRSEGTPQPRGAFLLSPWVDVEASSDTVIPHEEFDYLNRPSMLWAGELYARGQTRDPHVSAVHADFAGLPPMIVQTGGVECLRGENEIVVARARSAGVDVVHQIYDHMVHVWQAFAPVQPIGRDAIAELGKFVKGRNGREQVDAA